jgi:flagellar protein FliS
MFASADSPSHRRGQASAYSQVLIATSVDGATPHRLVSLLYRSIAGEIAAARGAITRADIAEKGRGIAHAVRIIEEGLWAPLDIQAGGALALDLRGLYQYLVHRLTLANLKSDDAVLAECASLVEVLRDGWDGIAEQVEAPAREAA